MSTKTISEIRNTWQRRKKIGTGLAIRKILSLVNERGIRAAEARFLPLYWLLFIFGVLAVLGFSMGALDSTSTIMNILGIVLGLSSLVVFCIAWPFSAVILYWDCKVVEKNTNSTLWLGKLLAISAIVFGAISLGYYLLYWLAKSWLAA